MSIPVLEVHLGEDGVWEAFQHPIFGSDDLETVESLADLARVTGVVRIGGALKPLTVYATGSHEGWIVWDDAL
jgi:hypothetical protein